MIKQSIIFLFSFLFFTSILSAQRANVLYVELLGPGLVYSVNYDTRLFPTDGGLGFRIGVGYLKREESNLSIPIQLNYLLGKSKHKLELGAGIASFYQEDGENKELFIFPSGALMYRFQSMDNSLTYRIGWSPIFAPDEEGAIISSKIFWVWPGVSVGYRF